MVALQPPTGLLSKYTAVLWHRGIARRHCRSAGRGYLIVDPVVGWVFARRNVTPTLERALRKVLDDWIEWDGNAGFIDDIGFRGTRVRTFNNETVTVPNTELATIPVTNRMSNETLRIAYSFGVGYGDDLSGELTVHEPPHS
jgi:hypothetical protein